MALLPSQQRAVASDTPPITFKAYAKGNKAFEAIAELDAQYPKEERNVQPGGEPSEHVSSASASALHLHLRLRFRFRRLHLYVLLHLYHRLHHHLVHLLTLTLALGARAELR